MASEQEKDKIFGRNISRPHNFVSGGQWSTSSSSNSGKRPTSGPPIQLGVSSPFLTAGSDQEWIQTFGGSLDAVFSIINGRFVQTSIDEIEVDGIYKLGTVNSSNDNLWSLAGNHQQIQYMVSQNTVAKAALSNAWYGAINEIRGFGLRVPSMAGGYGRTIDGLPTDPEPSEDTTGRKNDETHKLARETWKYGPVELRWDYRKGVWSAYNELIADHEDVSLGTWVFSTNDDDAEGFPFLRGRLEDVWWVRQPFALDGADGKTQGTRTGEIMTHLNHRLFDEDEDGAAALNTIFIIPHTISTDPDCHPKGEENILGSEITGDGEAIDIRTTVHFWKEVGQDGPIKFGRKASEVELCCQPSNGKYFAGEMIFLDQPIESCPESTISSAAAIAPDASESPCEWVPAVKIDECELVGEHFVKLIRNDANLGIRISNVCNDVSTWSTAAVGTINGNFGAIATAIECLNDELAGLAMSATNLILRLISSTNARMTNLEVRIQDAFEQMADEVQTALLECGCETSVAFPLLDATGGAVGIGDDPALSVDNCPVNLVSVDEFDCDNCYGTHIAGPCTTQEEFVAGKSCAGATPPTITTNFGECQAH